MSFKDKILNNQSPWGSPPGGSGGGGSPGSNGHGIIFSTSSVQNNSSGNKTLPNADGGVIVGSVI